MKIQIKEVGAIKSGNVDLSKKLNVFCGPNGTGKTYMAYIIYGLMKSRIHVGSDRILTKKLIENRRADFEINYDSLNNYRNDLIENLKNDLDSLFGIGKDLAKQYFQISEIEFGESIDEFRENIFNLDFKKKLVLGKLEVEVRKFSYTDVLELEIGDKTISNKDIESLDLFLYSILLSLLATFPISSTYILPVERNSIFTFSKELSIRKQEAVDHFHAMTSKDKIDRFELLFSKTTRYSLPIKDGLMIADDLAEIKKTTSEFYDFAVEIENELLHGKVQITDEGEIQFKPEKAPKRLLPIHMTASVVKSLSSLVVYLKHIAVENDLIIIDEPEINLHPDNQIILTRLFARLINKGFRLLISTHSDYVVREINNLIMLSSLNNEVKILKEKFGYKDDESLNSLDVEIHYFNYPQKKTNNKQVIMELLPLDRNGFEIPSIDKTIEIQNEISEELFYALNYSSNE